MVAFPDEERVRTGSTAPLILSSDDHPIDSRTRRLKENGRLIWVVLIVTIEGDIETVGVFHPQEWFELLALYFEGVHFVCRQADLMNLARKALPWIQWIPGIEGRGDHQAGEARRHDLRTTAADLKIPG